MKNSKIAQVLRTFSRREFKEFEKFAASPFFRKGRELKPLLKVLKKYYPRFDQRSFTKENIYRQIHKGSYNDKLMKTLMSDLLKMSNEYLIQLTIRNLTPEIQSAHCYEMNRRKLGFLSVRGIASLQNALKGNMLGESYFRTLIYLYEAKIGHNLMQDHQILVCDDVKSKAEYVLYHYLSSAMKSLHNMDANKLTFNARYESHISVKFLRTIDFEAFLNRLDGTKYKNIIEIYLFALITRLNESDETYFYKLKESLFKHINRFERDEQEFLLLVYEGLCVMKSLVINSEKYQRERFESRKVAISKKLHKRSEQGHFPILRFLSIFILALQLGEHAWAQEFVTGYINEVSPEYRRNMQAFCRALLNFEKGNFDEAQKDAVSIDFKVFTLKTEVRNLTLKIYYEMNYLEEAFYIVDSYTHFLSKNKNVADILKDRRRHFLKYYRTLLLLKGGEKAPEINELKKAISETQNISEKTWLLEKVEELKRRAENFST